MKKLVLGVLAHVDAGKTTLSEALLYTCGSIRKLGRVDHRNTALDTHKIERERGITVFSKQAQLRTDNMELCLLDTPGHADLTAETERTLDVIDYALLVISGTDGVQAHTETLWRLLERHNVPTMIFVTKMDLTGSDRQRILSDLRERLSEGCFDISDNSQEPREGIAMCDEELFEKFASGQDIASFSSGVITFSELSLLSVYLNPSLYASTSFRYFRSSELSFPVTLLKSTGIASPV